LFLASRQGAQFKNEPGVTGAVRSALNNLVALLEPLAHPLWVRTA
jgi:hypothetical protein